MSRFALSLCVCVAALTMPALAGDIIQFSEEPQSAKLMRPNSISLYNSSDQDIIVFLASQDSTEKRFNVAGRDRWTFSDESSSRYTIRIPTTSGRQVRYRLNANNRYEIFWNADAEVWDVALIHER